MNAVNTFRTHQFWIFFGVCVYVKSWLGNIPTLPGIIRGARLRMLRSGHSHEDVDQTFGALAGHLSRRARRATGPHQFRDIIQNWLDNDLKRPFEPKRYAVLMDQVRDWLLVSNLCL